MLGVNLRVKWTDSFPASFNSNFYIATISITLTFSHNNIVS